MKRLLLLIIPVLALAFVIPPKKNITVWLIGDSTMSVKSVSTYPETGWGMPFVYFWDSTVKVDNRAMNGRSTRTFMQENRWEPVVKAMEEGDYVFIQFGHNDEVPTKASYVKEDDFKKNLWKYIYDTRSKKGIPVLLTPVARRKFDSTGHVVDTHAAYAQLVRDVAKESKTPLIDLSVRSMALLEQLGADDSRYLFNHLVAGQHPNYPNGKIDDTHFNELGARRMAELVLADIRTQLPDLVARIKVSTLK